MAYKNLEERYVRFKNILNIWYARDLSLKGKITILKSVAIPQLMYSASAVYVPDDYIDKVDKDLTKWTKILLNLFGTTNPPK